MKSFPLKMCPKNKERFSEYKFNRELCKLRQRVLEYVYSEDKNGLDLRSTNDSSGQYSYNHIDSRLIDEIIKELNNLGWKTKLAYGDTTLFIYENESELPIMSDAVEF